MFFFQFFVDIFLGSFLIYLLLATVTFIINSLHFSQLFAYEVTLNLQKKILLGHIIILDSTVISLLEYQMEVFVKKAKEIFTTFFINKLNKYCYK